MLTRNYNAVPIQQDAVAAEPVRRAAIPGFPGYEVDSCGVVWSLRRRRPAMVKTHHREKYPRVTLSRERRRGGRVVRRVHVLVALAFLGPKPSPAHEVRHLDDNKHNNALANLAWGTRADNIADRRRNGGYDRYRRNPGHVGGYGYGYSARRSRWRAYVYRGGRQVSVGVFATAEEARDAAAAARAAEVGR